MSRILIFYGIVYNLVFCSHFRGKDWRLVKQKSLIINNIDRQQQMENRYSKPSKKDLKTQKWQRTQSHQSPYFTRKQAEKQLKNLEEDKNESQYQDPILKRAMKWWQRIDKEYFKTITLEETINKRDLCTSNMLIGLVESDSYGLGEYRRQLSAVLPPSFLDSNKIRILFKNKSPYQSILATFSIQSAIVNYHNQPPQHPQPPIFKITSKHKPNPTKMINQNTEPPKHIKLDLQDYEENENICQKVEKLQEIQNNSLYLHQIDKQIAIWEWELQKVNQENYINWNKLIKNVQDRENQCKIIEIGQFDNKIRDYRDKLYWGTVLRSFEHGFKDKTKKMLDLYIQNQKNHSLKPPKTHEGVTSKHHSHKKIFQTDCKICFSSDNSDSNQVLYCDSCNTSFHLICYGMTSVPQQDNYYCQRCTYLKKQQDINSGTKYRKPYCQICLKTSFPMKKLDNHFYHVTCLVLFNFVEFRENKMVLKGSLTHQNIIKMVIQNQIMHQECVQCVKIGSGTQLGMQIKCSYEGCDNYCHPICAYLNGYKFQLKVTPQKSLEVKMFCNQHLGSRVEQVYLRRYMCNLNETSSKSFPQIKSIFEAEQQNLKKMKQLIMKNKKRFQNRILILSRFIKNLLKSRAEKGEQQIETQTQAILRKLKDKKTN